MSEKFTLSLEPRSVLGKKVKRLRRSGILPATVYGKGVEPIAVQVDTRSFQAIYRQAGRTSLIELHITGHPPLAAFIHALQRHPVTRDIIHADFARSICARRWRWPSRSISKGSRRLSKAAKQC